MNLDLRFDFCEIFIECLKGMRPKKGGIYKKVWKEIVKEIEFMFSGTKRNVLMEQIKRGPSENEKVLSKIAEDCELLEEQVAELESVSGCSLTELIRKFKSGKVNISVDAQPVVHAEWIPIEYDGYADGNPVWDVWECKNCGCEHRGESDSLTAYCPDCGARMVAEDEQT